MSDSDDRKDRITHCAVQGICRWRDTHDEVAVVAVRLVCLQPAFAVPVFHHAIGGVKNSQALERISYTIHLRTVESWQTDSFLIGLDLKGGA